jgi:excisionase family DNA binding protein
MAATRITGPFNPRLLRTKDAASYLGMSPGQIRRLVQDGVLPVIKNGTGEHAPFLARCSRPRFICRTRQSSYRSGKIASVRWNIHDIEEKESERCGPWQVRWEG